MTSQQLDAFMGPRCENWFAANSGLKKERDEAYNMKTENYLHFWGQWPNYLGIILDQVYYITCNPIYVYSEVNPGGTCSQISIHGIVI